MGRFNDFLQMAMEEGRIQSPPPTDPFDMAANTKPAIKAPDKNEAIRILRQKNFVRMSRMEKDFRWMKREMKKMGLNPEDARYLL